MYYIWKTIDTTVFYFIDRGDYHWTTNKQLATPYNDFYQAKYTADLLDAIVGVMT